ncbi:MAG: flippase [Candidatus Uhrbacteria bacterium]|nr:flippase [Patescibacteria group bacterium]MBU1906738.1 flippase [Patescibacteria group bacterium]
MTAASIAKNTLYFTAASVGQKVIAFVYFMFIARVMGVDGTGAYFLALSITTIFSVVADFGMQPVLVREIAKGKDPVKLIRSVIGIKLPFILFGVGASIIAVYALGYNSMVRELVMLAAIVMALDSVHFTFYGILRGERQLRFESLGVFVGQILILLFGGAVLLIAPGLHLLIVALMCGSAFNALYSASRVYKHFGSKVFIPMWDAEVTRVLIKIAIPFFLAGAFVKVYSYVDTILLSKYLDETAVGLYAIAYKLTYAFQFLPMAFVAALYPGLSALLVSDKTKVTEVFEDAMWYMMILVTPIVLGIWSIAPELVISFAGAEYAGSILPLQVLIFVLFFIFLDFPIGSLLNAADRQGTKTAIMGVTMVVNVVLNFIFIPQFGILGACYAALGSFFVLLAGGLIFVPQIIPLKWGRLIKKLFPIMIAGLVMATVAYFSKQYLHFVLVIALAGVIYFALLFAFKSLKMEHIRHAVSLFKEEKHAPSTTLNS